MKYLLLAIFFLIGVQALTEDAKAKIKEHYQPCVDETHASKELIERARDGDFTSDDENVKKFFACMFRKMDVMLEDGTFNVDHAASMIPSDDREKVTKGFEECKEKKGDSLPDIAWNYCRCLERFFTFKGKDTDVKDSSEELKDSSEETKHSA